MSESNKVTIQIPSSSEFVGVVRLAISGIASRMNFTVEDIEDIKIAISEACTNAVQHAYPSGTGIIDVTTWVKEEGLEIHVSDTGIGFNTEILGTKNQQEKSEQKLGLGLGITFIKNLMDTATVTSSPGQGTCIQMTKKRPSDILKE